MQQFRHHPQTERFRVRNESMHARQLHPSSSSTRRGKRPPARASCRLRSCDLSSSTLDTSDRIRSSSFAARLASALKLFRSALIDSNFALF